MADNIQVMVRVRPLNDREKREGAKSCIILEDDTPNSITIDAKPEPKSFKFDFVGGDKTSQEDIFQIAAKPLMIAALEGYNACIFAYGQTGAGKTFTMQGRGLEEDRDSKERGVQPRVFDHLFALTGQQKKEGNVEYLVKCSYLEIYNEQIMDLLSNTQSNLMVREDLKKGVYIEGLTEEIAKNSDETIQLLLRGMRNRHVGATNMNFESSRSHSVFSMTIESKKTQDGMINVKVSKLHFVDLAGSERQKQTAAAGDRLKEASNINKSLTTLGLVINSLVEQAQGRNRHIPYRDSKLTFLLKDSLGGNSRTYMIAAVSAASTSFQETLSTLQFAQRAKMIKNKASINEEAQGSVESLKKEIKRLKEDLSSSRSQVISLEEQIKGGVKIGGMEIEDENEEQQDEIIEGEENSTQIKPKREQKIFNEDESRIMMEENNKCLELEEEIKRTVTSIQNSIEGRIVPELSKKDQYLQTYHQGVVHQDACETHHKAILALFQQRISRLNKLITEKFDESVLKQTITESQELVNEQYEELLKLMAETPNIMNVFDENVELRQKLDKFTSEGTMEEEIDLKTIVENIKKIGSISEVLTKSLEERKFIRERLEKLTLSKLPANDKVRAIEDQMHSMKIEHNDSIQALNYDLANLKQKEHAQERALEQERNKSLQLKQEIIKLKEQRAKDLQNHQEEIEELLNQFNQIDDQKNQATDEYEQNIGQLNRRIIELETKLSAQKQQTAEAQADLEAKEGLLNSEHQQREQIQKELNEKIDAFSIEKCELENKLNAMKSKIQLMSEELLQSQENSNDLKQRVHQLEGLEAQMEQLTKDKNEELKRLEHLMNEKSDELIHLQQQMETEDDKLATYEQEKNKISEELGILTDTYNYQLQEMEEKNSLLLALNEKLKNAEKEIEELKLKASDSVSTSEDSEVINGSNIKREGNENQVLKQNKELQEQNHQLRLQVEFESNQNITLRSQMNTLSNRVTELQQSEKHFRAAYLEVRNQLQSLSQRNKDLQQALSSKEMEQYELQRDMKSANENVQFLQERMTAVKNEMKSKEREAIEADNRLKKCKETVIKLQENLRSKMDNLQQALMKNGELETKMAVLLRESAQLKTELKGKSSLSEKRVQELLQSFAQQRAEMQQMQKIINAKIEENIALTANNRLLQSLIEKYTTNEWEMKQQIKSMTDKEAQYKKRIDHLIQEYGKLEQESITNPELEQMESKIKTFIKDIENLQRDNERLRGQQQFIIKEKDSIISQLQQSVIEKEKELKEVHSKIAQIQAGIQQAQQYFNKYQQVSEENKKMRADIDLRDHQLKSLENQLKILKSNQQNFSGNDINNNPNNSSNNSNNNNSNKYKEKFVQLEEKYQNLKKKYIQLQQQFEAAQIQLQDALNQLHSSHASNREANAGGNNGNQNIQVQNLQHQLERVKRHNDTLIQQVAQLSSNGKNDVVPEMSSRIHQLCEFVLSQLTVTNKDLLNNIPKLEISLENNMIFIVHAFNNLFEDIKIKEGAIQNMTANEVKSHKKMSSLEKELLILKKKLTNLQTIPPSSSLPTPKASVTSSVYKMPQPGGFGSNSLGMNNANTHQQNNHNSNAGHHNSGHGNNAVHHLFQQPQNSYQTGNYNHQNASRDLTNNHEPLPGESLKKKIKF